MRTDTNIPIINAAIQGWRDTLSAASRMNILVGTSFALVLVFAVGIEMILLTWPGIIPVHERTLSDFLTTAAWYVLHVTVRRQSFWDSERDKLREALARLVGDVRRLACDAASGVGR